jgi:hypothetical protein
MHWVLHQVLAIAMSCLCEMKNQSWGTETSRPLSLSLGMSNDHCFLTFGFWGQCIKSDAITTRGHRRMLNIYHICRAGTLGQTPDWGMTDARSFRFQAPLSWCLGAVCFNALMQTQRMYNQPQSGISPSAPLHEPSTSIDEVSLCVAIF